jgi:pimeloyl-ACP methyl ester carboxylesterase
VPLKAFLEEWYSQPLFEGLEVPWTRRLCHDPEKLALFLERFSVAVVPAPILHQGTLFVYGERDLKYKTLYRTLPSHASVEALPSAGHAVHLENPRRCAQLIGAAYDDHPFLEGERNALARDS